MTTEPDEKGSNATFWWAVLLIALGVVLLLRSLGVFVGSSLSVLVTYWPLLLIGFGLDYLFKDDRSGRREIPFGVLSLLVLAALMVLNPLFGLAPSPQMTAEMTTERFTEPLGETRSARIELELRSAPTAVTALSSTTDLIDATVTHRGRTAFSVRGGADKVVRLSQQRGSGFDFGFGSSARARWDVALTPHIPLDLRLGGGSGPATFELAGLNLSQLEFDGGSGSATFTLPASEARYAVTLDGGSGSTAVNVTEGAVLELSAETGSGATDITLAQNVDAVLELEGGSGAIRVLLSADTDARLEVEDDGSGPLEVGGRFIRVSGDGDEGVWETPGFEQAERQVLITVEDAGSGSIVIR